jgi:hypothetical protein
MTHLINNKLMIAGNKPSKSMAKPKAEVKKPPAMKMKSVTKKSK